MAGFLTTDEAALARPDAVAHLAASGLAGGAAYSSVANRSAQGAMPSLIMAEPNSANCGAARVAVVGCAKRRRAVLASWLAAGLAIGQAGFVVAAQPAVQSPVDPQAGPPRALPKISTVEDSPLGTLASHSAAIPRLGAPRVRVARAEAPVASAEAHAVNAEAGIRAEDMAGASDWSAPRPIGRSHEPISVAGWGTNLTRVASARPRLLPQPDAQSSIQSVAQPSRPSSSACLPERWVSWQSPGFALSGPENFSAQQLPLGDSSAEPVRSEPVRSEQVEGAFAWSAAKRVNEVKSPPQARSESLTVVQLLRETRQYQRRAQELLDRGAIYAAHDAAVKSLHAAATANDVGAGQRVSGQALSAAMRAFHEAGDFLGRYGHPDAERMRGMVASHSTPVLKGCTLAEVAPLEAANIYLDFARERLTTAVMGRPEAADSLRLLGEIERRRDSYPESMRDALAITCLRAAVATDLNNAELVGSLGREASRLGLLEEARWALESSLALEPSREVLAELIVTHRRSGDQERASELAARLRSWGGAPAANQLDVLQLSPGEFASISPPVQNGSMAAPVPMNAGSINGGPGAVGRQASGPAGVSPAATGASAEAADAKEVSVLDRVASAVRSILQ